VAPEPRRPPDGAPAAGDSDDSGDSADPGAEDPAFGAWPGQALGLSERESEVLALICQGLSNDDITKRAYLSINTVKTYIRTLYRKIGVTSRTQAVLWGLDHGFEPDRIARRVDS
jgi:DNA-binding NarL/FixJ family response regulator